MALPGNSDAFFVPQAPARKAEEAQKSERKMEHEFKQAIKKAEKANRRQQDPASATKPSYEEVTTRGRAAESSAPVGAEAADIEELRPGYIPLHARDREENARIREQRERERGPSSASEVSRLTQTDAGLGVSRSATSPTDICACRSAVPIPDDPWANP